MSEAPEMIERVARALAVEDSCDPDFVDRAGRIQWTYHVGAARVAIEAMRDPPPAIICAVEDMAEERYNAAPLMQRWYGEDVWNAGIDAALSDSRTGAEQAEVEG